MISGATEADLKLLNEGNQKKKKKKLSLAEKALIKLDKQADALKNSGILFSSFVHKMDQWLMKNHKTAIALFTKFDHGGEGAVTYSEFKAGMFDLNAPCNSVELHLLTKLLDRNEIDGVEYTELSKGLSSVREREEDYELQDIRPALTLTKRSSEQCPCCKMAHWDGDSYKVDYPRYIELELRLVTFDGQSHPGHFKKVVHSHVSVAHLAHIIQESTQILTTKLAIFRDKSREPGSILSPDMSLEDYGFQGGTVDKPINMRLFYDYVVEFKECPLLLCDHYFGQNIAV